MLYKIIIFGFLFLLYSCGNTETDTQKNNPPKTDTQNTTQSGEAINTDSGSFDPKVEKVIHTTTPTGVDITYKTNGPPLKFKEK